jgi:hypothetical protein
MKWTANSRDELREIFQDCLTTFTKIFCEHVERLILVSDLYKLFSARDISIHKGNHRIDWNNSHTTLVALRPHRDNRRIKFESAFSHVQT